MAERQDAGFRIPSFKDLRVTAAKSNCDLEIVSHLREQGFGRFDGSGANGGRRWLDDSDRLPETLNLISWADETIPVGTMRLTSSKNGPTELDDSLDLATHLDVREKPYVQCSRLTAIGHSRSRDGMFALFKSAWMIAESCGHGSFVAASPPWAEPTYRMMKFREVVAGFTFESAYSGGHPHKGLVLPIWDLENYWMQEVPLFELFFRKEHPKLDAGQHEWKV